MTAAVFQNVDNQSGINRRKKITQFKYGMPIPEFQFL
jgi:hypothetical protein